MFASRAFAPHVPPQTWSQQELEYVPRLADWEKWHRVVPNRSCPRRSIDVYCEHVQRMHRCDAAQESRRSTTVATKHGHHAALGRRILCQDVGVHIPPPGSRAPSKKHACT